jgi:hypothetical protein
VLVRRPAAAVAVLLALAVSGCSGASDGLVPNADDQPSEVSQSEVPDAPDPGACRVLEPSDIAKASDDTEPVPCAEPHNAETFVVGAFRGDLADADYDDERLGRAVYERCSHDYRRFTGADESLALRSVLSWAWFRPSEDEWDAGARWYRCDVVGGTDRSAELVELPRTAKGVLLGIPGDRWMSCVDSAEVSAVPPVPCTEPHTWRAVTTVVVGKQKDPYPGDRLVEVQSRDFCSNSVGAWMNYPIDYEYAYTWFHKAEWEAGNRRSICWAGTRK